VPYRHVVVGTDGSPTATTAVEAASSLAAASGADLTVVTAYEIAPGDFAGGAVQGAVAPDAAEACALEAVGIAGRAGVAADSRIGAGEPAAVIVDIARAVGADLIVVGSRGMSNAARFVIGSVGNRVSHHAPCDVLIVPTGP
jgi:nucleotide-binding universal stress UspA family protein